MKLDNLHPAFEHRARLAIAVLLAASEEITFSTLKQHLNMTDGNLGAQLRRLEEEGLITLRRDFADRKPVTWYALTGTGRKTLNKHLGALQSIINTAS